LLTGLCLSVTPFILSFVLPPLKSYLFGSYRLKVFFDNSIQYAIALAVIFPIAVAEFTIARRLVAKLAWAAVLIVMAYTLFRTGSKTAMFLTFTVATMLYITISLRSRSLLHTLSLLVGVVLLGGLLWMYSLDVAEALDPKIAEKMRSIVEGGVKNYHSVESRKLLWREAIDQGQQHWLIGTGAGEKVLGIEHAHNLVIDYFKGIGVFGAAAVVVLCLCIFFRTAAKGLAVIAGRAIEDRDKRLLACYVGASVYVVCNQMSDCFGPATIGGLWVVYLSAVLSERGRILRP
jgi:O-antigen ligase